jgi:hypothetical protein
MFNLSRRAEIHVTGMLGQAGTTLPGQVSRAGRCGFGAWKPNKEAAGFFAFLTQGAVVILA